MHDLLKKYMEQVVDVKKDVNGAIVSETLGVTKILDSHAPRRDNQVE